MLRTLHGSRQFSRPSGSARWSGRTRSRRRTLFRGWLLLHSLSDIAPSDLAGFVAPHTKVRAARKDETTKPIFGGLSASNPRKSALLSDHKTILSPFLLVNSPSQVLFPKPWVRRWYNLFSTNLKIIIIIIVTSFQKP